MNPVVNHHNQLLRALGWLKLVLAFQAGVMVGAATPYLFNLVAMLLRHCGGM